MEEFEQFWSAYPKKKSKGDARKAWIQTAGIRPTIDELLAAVDRGRASVQWHKADREGTIGAFIPYPASWLRAEGWDDDYAVRLLPIGGRSSHVRSDPPPSVPTEEQKAEARRLMSEFKLKRVG